MKQTGLKKSLAAPGKEKSPSMEEVISSKDFRFFTVVPGGVKQRTSFSKPVKGYMIKRIKDLAISSGCMSLHGNDFLFYKAVEKAGDVPDEDLL